jgi:hypothetical protein
MLWQALIIVTVIGIGLPASAWWFTRRMASAKAPYSRTRMDAFGAPMDAVDAWFTDHTALPAVRRWNVRQAVFGGRVAEEQSLRPIAHQLATALLAGQVKSDVEGWSGWALAAAGGAEVIFAIAACLVVGHVVPWLVSSGAYGVVALAAGLVRPKLLRHRLERAVRLNT